MNPTASDLLAARQRIAQLVHCTPVLTATALNEMAGAELYFKCENFQKVGAFKARGASHALRVLPPEKGKQGVATHSSGNHGQALAWAANQFGYPAWVVMPSNAPEVKVAAVRGYGAEVVFCEPTLQARENTLKEVIARTGAHEVHPFADWRVVLGQSTCAQEFFEQTPQLDYLLCPVGGGGLLGGTLLAAHHFSPQTKVIAAEPHEANDAFRSWKAKQHIPLVQTHTIADGLRTSLGDINYGLMMEFVDSVLETSEEEIIAAMKLLWERLKVVIEPSCAVPFAALLANRQAFAGKRVGIILTGGNVDLGKLPF